MPDSTKPVVDFFHWLFDLLPSAETELGTILLWVLMIGIAFLLWYRGATPDTSTDSARTRVEGTEAITSEPTEGGAGGDAGDGD